MTVAKDRGMFSLGKEIGLRESYVMNGYRIIDVSGSFFVLDHPQGCLPLSGFLLPLLAVDQDACQISRQQVQMKEEKLRNRYISPSCVFIKFSVKSNFDLCIIVISCVGTFCLNVYVCDLCMPGALRYQKMMLKCPWKQSVRWL